MHRGLLDGACDPALTQFFLTIDEARFAIVSVVKGLYGQHPAVLYTWQAFTNAPAPPILITVHRAKPHSSAILDHAS